MSLGNFLSCEYVFLRVCTVVLPAVGSPLEPPYKRKRPIPVQEGKCVKRKKKYFPPLKTSPSEDSGLFFCDHSSVAVVDLLAPVKEKGKGKLVKEDETNHTTSEQLKGTRRKMVIMADSPRHLRKSKRSKKGIVKPRKV